ncbi:MAG: CHAT domain-containing protein [Candidatus Binatia bacterium]
MAPRRRPRRSKTITKSPDVPNVSSELHDGLRAYSYSEKEIEKLLVMGEDSERLRAYFGDENYEELRELAHEAQAQERRARGGPRVLILPGIMGSTIGKRRPIFDDVIWFDPIDIIRGNLMVLALNGKSSYTSLDAIPLAYTGLRLRLRIAGYDADYHHYDWRLSIDDLGAGLVTRLRHEAAEDVFLVAHSMGGLVARSAIAQRAPKIRRLIMLGTPNHGSFVPAQSIRGVYSVVKQIAALDRHHDVDQLSAKVFTTFPGLYQMLPTTEKFGALDLYDAANWPKRGPKPRQPMLDRVQSVQQSLAKADDRFFLIAGVNQETTVSLRLEQDEFVYDYSIEGDGTVPLALAELAGAQTYYADESHGSLPNNRIVAKAVSDLLATGATSELPQEWAPVRRGLIRSVTDKALQIPPYGERQGTDLTKDEVRHALEPVVSPDAHDTGVTATGKLAVSMQAAAYLPEFNQIVVGRRRQQRIDIRLALGSITEVDTRAYVLGVYRDVTPSGPAAALDERLGGAIKDFTARRMFSGNAGEIFVLPTGRHPLAADLILFIGLGHFDRMTPEVLQLAAENVLRTCVRTKIEEFATVLVGAGSGPKPAAILQNLLTGFFRALKDSDREQSFRRITFCELDRARYEEIRQELLLLSSTPLFDEVEITLDEITVPPAPLIARAVVAGLQPIYLIVRQEEPQRGMLQFQSSVLTAGAKATVITDTRMVEKRKLDAHLSIIETAKFTPKSLDGFGDKLANMVLAERVISVLPSMRDRHVVIVHDALSSRVPWEVIRVNGWCPAVNAGLSRRYVADNLSVAKWLEQRQQAPILNLLTVINPTLDLPGAKAEGKRIRELFGSHPSIKITELYGAEATRPAVLGKIKSADYDVIHYAGHAFFDEKNPAGSGILCHGDQVLSGADLASIGNLPSLVFFNACEAGRIRKAPARGKRAIGIAKRADRAVGLAEAFLRGGVANYLGTYWPVGDEAASAFAETFYTALLNRKTIGAALLAGRHKVQVDVGSVDWADYIHYGSYDFVLKQG